MLEIMALHHGRPTELRASDLMPKTLASTSLRSGKQSTFAIVPSPLSIAVSPPIFAKKLPDNSVFDDESNKLQNHAYHVSYVTKHCDTARSRV